MKERYFKTLLLSLLLLMGQTAWAAGVTRTAFYETFSANNGTGGRDGQNGGNIATSNPHFDIDGWSFDSYIKGAYECIRFGTYDHEGVLTTPEIYLLGKKATLTFEAAGWSSSSNHLDITANEGVTLKGQTTYWLGNGSSFQVYEVEITLTTATYVQLTFRGSRGFLDDVKVEEDVTAINAPTLTDEHFFWPNTYETPTTNVTLIPSYGTTVYYTTDGSEPSKTNGSIATLTSNIQVTGTTTVKARAYYETVASDLVTRTYTVGEDVGSIEAFAAKNDGDEVRLYIGADAYARVLYAADGKMYLRDNTGTLCIDLGTADAFNPAPQHDQHVAGWIIGRKQTEDGLLKLVATSNTNTNYLALAAPVTEPATEPVLVNNMAAIVDHIGDWVKADNVRNDHSVEYIDCDNNILWDYALADLAGIVTTESKMTPVDIGGFPAVVYVLDEDKDFVSPPQDIQNATVRLKRTLKKDIWNTFVVPIDIQITEDISGEYRQFFETSGDIMIFKRANQIDAGMPYLVKPDKDIVNKVFTNVTLTRNPESAKGEGGYSIIGTYSPKELLTDKTQLFLTASGQLAYPSSESVATIKGMRAYFEVPDGASLARLYIDDMEDGLLPASSSPDGDGGAAWYDIAGRRIADGHQPTAKGLYIHNGKKLLIK